MSSIWSIFYGHIFLSRSNMLKAFKGFLGALEAFQHLGERKQS